MTTASVFVTIEAHTCGKCGVVFGMSTDYIAERKRDRKSWHCPNGCVRHFIGQTDAERLTEELGATRQRLDAARSVARAERERRQTADYRARAARGQVTKIKRRIARGVCPCCDQTFTDLATHMAYRHPDYTPEETHA